MHTYTYICVECVCVYSLLTSVVGERTQIAHTRRVGLQPGFIVYFPAIFLHGKTMKTALTQQVDYSISAYSTRQQGRKVIYHGFSFSTLKGATIRPKMTGHQSLWSWHGLNKSKHRSLTDWPVIFTLKPIVWVWNLMFVVSSSSYWCLVGNGWEWGNGMIITSDGGSFPHSLLSNSKSF